MRPFRWILVLLATSVWSYASGALGGGTNATAPDLFQQGVAAYVEQRYDDAASAFRQAVARRPASGSFHNLGIAQWNLGRPGEAVLAWERALWLAPGNRDAKAALRFARTVARLQPPNLTWYEVCSTWLPASAWATIAMLSFWAAAAFAWLPALLRWRKPDAFQAFAAAGFAIFILTLPALYGLHTRSRLGVIRTPDTALRLTPTREAQTLTRLPAGEVVRLLKSRGPYACVRTDADVAGWVLTGELGLLSRPDSTERLETGT